ncbi:MAG: hypothetical protein JXK94_03900 [Deltaproteobacteria bacterium]|nr:hypothetical protein [Deltaproteobacteria bacterium]
MKISLKHFPGLIILSLSAVLLTFWLTAASCTHASDTAKAATAEEAFARVKYRIDAGSFRNYEVYISEQPLAGGSSIPSWGKKINVPSGYNLAWFLFVDDQPEANWQHACRYFFVSVESGRFAIVPAKTPPDNWSDMKKIYSSQKRP